ncbi:MAG: methyltransferase domain-containing protein, partial [Bacteroidales bacterium]|nr:methyltransferase domain-containing protein [Bacteroidales bacterium]
AHGLKTIDNESVDIVLNIESAFHYPDKMKFLKEIYRVLKPGGEFLIADVLISKQKNNSLIPFRQKWTKYNNWTLEQYLNSLLSVNLETNFCKDISNPIKKGIQTYRNWYKDIKVKGIFYPLLARIFIFLNAKWYSHMFKHSHKYFVFAGVKQ